MNCELFEIQSLTQYYYFKRDGIFCFSGHRHEDRELKFIISGELEITYGDKVMHLKKGDIVLYEPQVFHMEKNLTENAEFVVIQFRAHLPSEYGLKYTELEGEELALMNLIVSEMNSLYTQNGIIYNRDYVMSAKKLIEVIVYKLYSLSSPYPVLRDHRTEIYSRAVSFMNEHLGESHSVDSIAHHCGVCTTVLKKVFSELTGTGAAKYYLRLRIEAAKRMLMNEESILQISENLGFSSPSYFSQCFARECGCTPMQFKSSLKKSE